MFDNIPTFRDLFDLLKDDPFWDQIGEAFFMIINVISNFLNNITDKNKGLEGKELENSFYYHLSEYIFRTLRFFSASILLCIFLFNRESLALYRPLIENIAETKFFLKTRRRRAIRKKKLYDLINEKRRYEFYQERYRRQIDELGILYLTTDMVKWDEELKEYVEGLNEFRHDEIRKMEENIKNNKSWHGMHIKQLLMEVDMTDKIAIYNTACTIVHIRDYPFISEEEIHFGSRYMALENIALLLQHIKDFQKTFCEIFEKDNIMESVELQINKIRNMLFDLAKKDGIEIIAIKPENIS